MATVKCRVVCTGNTSITSMTNDLLTHVIKAKDPL